MYAVKWRKKQQFYQRKNSNDLVFFFISAKHLLYTYHFSAVKLLSLWSFRIMASNNKNIEKEKKEEEKVDNIFISIVYILKH